MKFKSLPLLMAVSVATTGLVALNAKDSKSHAPLSKIEKVKLALPKDVVQPKESRKLLVFSVTRGYRHRSIDLGKKALKMLGEETGAFEVVVSDELSNFEKNEIEKFDAICFLNTTNEVFQPKLVKGVTLSKEERLEVDRREKRLQNNLLEFIKSGGGFVGIHAASDTFYKWSEYGVMLGGYFDGHPWTSKTDVVIKVDESAKGNPIVASMGEESLSFKEEIYQLKEPYNSKELDMLLRLDTEKSNMKVKGVKRKDGDFGVGWTKSYGKGRVFYCSLGHNEHIYWNPKVMSIYLNGIQWAMGDLQIKK
ncbi:MAG: ThuA domain-containing protein [Rubritalea sp.]|uniref:ThuA domain-containing protein n=1 Tax=Rubritalea sp. TaxID=2109375 RepID=UPI003242E545